MKISTVYLYNKNLMTQQTHTLPLFKGRHENTVMLLKRIGFCNGDAEFVAGNIIETYNKPQRGYHGIKHISDMLKSFNEFISKTSKSSLITNPDEFRFAILMHDYVNGEENDVEQSALQAKEFLHKISPFYDTSYVEKLITATDYSRIQNLNFEQGLMQDIDIEILGKSHDEYKKYSENIRRQYIDYPDKEFNPARIKILESFIGKSNIYNALYYRDRFEIQARENIAHEIKLLKAVD